MKIPSEDIPQADGLADVVKIVDSVAQGAKTFQDMAKSIDKVDRQGRYYRRAAEILGFIENQNNRSVLTKYGKAFVAAPESDRQQELARAVLSTRIMERVIPFLENAGAAGIDKGQLSKFIGTVTETDEDSSTLPRRASSILSWLAHIELVDEKDGNYILKGLPKGIDRIDYEDDEPLFPKSHELDEYTNLSDKVKRKQGDLTVLVDEAKRDRAVSQHNMLTNLMAEKIRNVHAIPKSTRVVDLCANINNNFFFFEMKSMTEENARKQIRTGISQLYEYQYIQGVRNAKLVLVLEGRIPEKARWMEDYLIKDRGIYPVWSVDEKSFDCPEELKKELGFIFA